MLIVGGGLRSPYTRIYTYLCYVEFSDVYVATDGMFCFMYNTRQNATHEQRKSRLYCSDLSVMNVADC